MFLEIIIPPNSKLLYKVGIKKIKYVNVCVSGDSAVLCGEAADGCDHRHPAGLREIQRRRLQVCSSH